MANKYKQVTISVSNDELDAMEDLLTAKLTKEETEKNKKKVLAVWKRLVSGIK